LRRRFKTISIRLRPARPRAEQPLRHSVLGPEFPCHQYTQSDEEANTTILGIMLLRLE
jgi:hypothetical protein